MGPPPSPKRFNPQHATQSQDTAATKSKAKSVPVDSIRHKEAKGKNVPTEELRDFVKEDEHQPRTMLDPRDPSLDPQLVWKGSLPFPIPTNKKRQIAVKVINHYGDEVLKVYTVK